MNDWVISFLSLTLKCSQRIHLSRSDVVRKDTWQPNGWMAGRVFMPEWITSWLWEVIASSFFFVAMSSMFTVFFPLSQPQYLADMILHLPHVRTKRFSERLYLSNLFEFKYYLLSNVFSIFSIVYSSIYFVKVSPSASHMRLLLCDY